MISSVSANGIQISQNNNPVWHSNHLTLLRPDPPIEGESIQTVTYFSHDFVLEDLFEGGLTKAGLGKRLGRWVGSRTPPQISYATL